MRKEFALHDADSVQTRNVARDLLCLELIDMVEILVHVGRRFEVINRPDVSGCIEKFVEDVLSVLDETKPDGGKHDDR